MTILKFLIFGLVAGLNQGPNFELIQEYLSPDQFKDAIQNLLDENINPEVK